MSVTEGTELLELSSLSFHCHIWCFISGSEVMFPCHMIVIKVWNSTYVVLIIKCVFILKMVCFLRFFEMQYITEFTVGGKSVISENIYCSSITQFSRVTSPLMFLIIFGTGFEVLTVVSIHNVVWVMTPYSLLRTVAYPEFFLWGGIQQIQLRTEDRHNGDLETVAS